MKIWKSLLLIVVATSLGACSSSRTKEADEFDLIPSSSDAGTDMAPALGTDLESGGFGDDPLATGDGGFGAEDSSGAKQTKSSRQPVDLGPTAPGEYRVQKGDTLMKIAFDTYGDIYRWRSIYEANQDKITDPNSISAGMTIRLERPVTPVAVERNGEQYLIKNGETLGTISSSLYGTPTRWKQLWENNRQMIPNPNQIFAGFYLYYLPDGASRQLSATEDANALMPQQMPQDSQELQPSMGLDPLAQ